MRLLKNCSISRINSKYVQENVSYDVNILFRDKLNSRIYLDKVQNRKPLAMNYNFSFNVGKINIMNVVQNINSSWNAYSRDNFSLGISNLKLNIFLLEEKFHKIQRDVFVGKIVSTYSNPGRKERFIQTGSQPILFFAILKNQINILGGNPKYSVSNRTYFSSYFSIANIQKRFKISLSRIDLEPITINEKEKFKYGNKLNFYNYSVSIFNNNINHTIDKKQKKRLKVRNESNQTSLIFDQEINEHYKLNNSEEKLLKIQDAFQISINSIQKEMEKANVLNKEKLSILLTRIKEANNQNKQLEDFISIIYKECLIQYSDNINYELKENLIISKVNFILSFVKSNKNNPKVQNMKISKDFKSKLDKDKQIMIKNPSISTLNKYYLSNQGIKENFFIFSPQNIYTKIENHQSHRSYISVASLFQKDKDFIARKVCHSTRMPFSECSES